MRYPASFYEYQGEFAGLDLRVPIKCLIAGMFNLSDRDIKWKKRAGTNIQYMLTKDESAAAIRKITFIKVREARRAALGRGCGHRNPVAGSRSRKGCSQKS